MANFVPSWLGNRLYDDEERQAAEEKESSSNEQET